ncbi:SRPBCC domain-containing protein [Desulfatibacillum aliphaticivorans]|uniref:SRPBCC domain-containing protein n=1 Tax=Desulfatibacillum aliphaticivorans TaxID=218208 RepID=UPI00040EF669|nr:SRPBCC domain-containing protein [Desulfatibacillum aliphaticivorans]
MRKIHTQIVINASAELVWSILTDLAGYGEWNPFILESAGRPALGARLTCRPRMPGTNRILTFHPKVTRCAPQKIFAWKGGVLFPGLADGEHIFEIHQQPDGGVLHVHRQAFSGLLSPFIPKNVLERTKTGFEMMNEALKARAEKKAGGG